MHEIDTDVEQIGEDLYFVAASETARRLRTQAEMFAQIDVPLLITGEPGSGKATVARLIHARSIRSSFPFAKVNCTALTTDLLEGDLFGYEHTSVSGPNEVKPGKLEQSGKATILLQGLEAMPKSVQSRLLKLLQTREFVRFGGQTPVRGEVRIMVSADSNLRQAVADGKVNTDLYYRLSAFEIKVPPLRERREGIPLLLGYFMNRLTRHYGVTAPPYSEALLQACQEYSWPGNLRQFEVFLKRFLVFGDEMAALEELELHPASEVVGGETNGRANGFGKNGITPMDEKSSLKSLVRQAKGEAERNAIARALEETHWNRKAAARALDISYRALLYKIQEYQLLPHEGLPIRAHGNGPRNGS